MARAILASKPAHQAEAGLVSRLVVMLRAFGQDKLGSLNLGAGLAIVGVVIGAVVTIAIVAALFPTFMGSLADINGEFNDPNTTTGDATADGLLPIFPILIGLGGLFAIVGIVLLAVRFRGSGGN